MVTDPFIQLFQCWSIDLIGQLLTTIHKNPQTITAIDYATEQPIAKAIPKADEKTIAEFIYNEIYMHYSISQEIFTNDDKNLWRGTEVFQ